MLRIGFLCLAFAATSLAWREVRLRRSATATSKLTEFANDVKQKMADQEYEIMLNEYYTNKSLVIVSNGYVVKGKAAIEPFYKQYQAHLTHIKSYQMNFDDVIGDDKIYAGLGVATISVGEGEHARVIRQRTMWVLENVDGKTKVLVYAALDMPNVQPAQASSRRVRRQVARMTPPLNPEGEVRSVYAGARMLMKDWGIEQAMNYSYRRDAILVRPNGEVIKGLPAIVEHYKQLVAAWKVQVVSMHIDHFYEGTSVFVDAGTTTIWHEKDGEEAQKKMTYATIWKKENNDYQQAIRFVFPSNGVTEDQ